MISSPFPHHPIASLRQVGMMGLTPLRFELNRVKLFATDLDTHKQDQTGTAPRSLFDGSAIIAVGETFAKVQ